MIHYALGKKWKYLTKKRKGELRLKEKEVKAEEMLEEVRDDYETDRTISDEWKMTKINVKSRYYYEFYNPNWEMYDYEELKRTIYDYFDVYTFSDRRLVAGYVLDQLINHRYEHDPQQAREVKSRLKRKQE